MDTFRSKHQVIIELEQFDDDRKDDRYWLLASSLSLADFDGYLKDVVDLEQLLQDGWRIAQTAARGSRGAVVFVLERPADVPFPARPVEEATVASVAREGECDNCGRKGRVVGVTAHNGTGPVEDPDGPEVMELCAGGCDARPPG